MQDRFNTDTELSVGVSYNGDVCMSVCFSPEISGPCIQDISLPTAVVLNSGPGDPLICTLGEILMN